MKEIFEKYLANHKGKVLTPELIKMLSDRLEDELYNNMVDNSLCFISAETCEKIIPDGVFNGTGEAWGVTHANSSQWEPKKSYKRLSTAIKKVSERN